MLDIITVGSAVIDVFVDTGIGEKKNFIAYPVGSKLLIKNLIFSTGGGGTNTGVSFSRLGLKTGYLGKIGTDENGKTILNLLKKEKIGFLGVKGREHTGYSVILDSKEHNRTILTYKGANDTLKFSELNLNKLKTKWFYFSSMMHESFKTQEKLVEYSLKNNIKIAFNPSSYQTKKGLQHLKDILAKAEVLVLNKEEAEMLVNKKDMLKGLYKLGPNIVCITEGKKGCSVYDGKYRYISKGHNIKVKERTGAGDAFASGFIAGIIKNKNIEFAIQLGSINAESVILHYGAKNKLLKWNEAIKQIKKSPVKLKKEVY